MKLNTFILYISATILLLNLVNARITRRNFKNRSNAPKDSFGSTSSDLSSSTSSSASTTSTTSNKTPPKDGCVILFEKCAFMGASIEVCEDVIDLKLLSDTNWKGIYPASFKIGKFITATWFFSHNYQGKNFIAKKDITCFKDVAFKNNPGAIQINHIRKYNEDKGRKNKVEKQEEKEIDKILKNIEKDRRTLFLGRDNKEKKHDSVDHHNKDKNHKDKEYKNKENKNHNDIDDVRGQIIDINRTLKLDSSNFPPVQTTINRVNIQPTQDLNENFKDNVSRRLFAIEQKLEQMQNERLHPVIACWDSIIKIPGDALLKDTLMIWNRTEFDKDPGYFKLSNDRTNIEVLKKGFYRIDAKITSNLGSNLQAILDINQKREIRFNASATKGDTQDATLVYYTDFNPTDNLAVFIASTGLGPNNILTDPVNRLCIRRIS